MESNPQFSLNKGIGFYRNFRAARRAHNLAERTTTTCDILLKQYFPFKFTYNSFVEVVIFVRCFVIFSRRAIEIDITRSKLR